MVIIKPCGLTLFYPLFWGLGAGLRALLLSLILSPPKINVFCYLSALINKYKT